MSIPVPLAYYLIPRAGSLKKVRSASLVVGPSAALAKKEPTQKKDTVRARISKNSLNLKKPSSYKPLVNCGTEEALSVPTKYVPLKFSKGYSNDDHSEKAAITSYKEIDHVVSVNPAAPEKIDRLISCSGQKIRFKLAAPSPIVPKQKRKANEVGMDPTPTKKLAQNLTYTLTTPLQDTEPTDLASRRFVRPPTPPVTESQTVFKPRKAHPKDERRSDFTSLPTQKREREDEGCAEHPSKVFCHSYVRSYNQSNEMKVVIA